MFLLSTGQNRLIKESLDNRIRLRTTDLRGRGSNGYALAVKLECFAYTGEAGALGSGREVLFDGIQQISGTAIVHKEEALADAPQWCRTELIPSGAPLNHSVR